MKVIFVFVALVAVALGAPQQWSRQLLAPRENPHEPEYVLLKQTPSNNNGLGNYHFAYEQTDGQTREETGELVDIGNDQHALRVKGSYSWVDPVSKRTYTVHYEADEHGFRPHVTHLPA